jgi:hypothetical protein
MESTDYFAWPAGRVVTKAEPGRRPQSFAKRHSVHHPGLGFSNAKQFPNVNLDQDVASKAIDNRNDSSRMETAPKSQLNRSFSTG